MSQNTISIQNNASIQSNVNVIKESRQRSKSSNGLINSTETKIIKKIFKKLKVKLIRPEIQKLNFSPTPIRIPNKNMTYQKLSKYEKNLVYNKKLFSERIRKRTNNKYVMNLKNIKISIPNINKGKNYNNFIIILLNILNKVILKPKKIFFNKIKYFNKIYTKKTINDNLNINNRSFPLSLLSNNKNFLEENYLEKKTIIYKNKNDKSNEIGIICSSENDSCDKNLTIISEAKIKKLNDSNSQGDEINDDYSVNGNYSYDKKDIIYNTDNYILKELNEELENNLNNRQIMSNRKNKIRKESLLFSEGRILTINKSENKNSKGKDDRTYKNIKSRKKKKIQFSPNINSQKKEKLFIDNISFEKIQINKLFENSNNKSNNKKINFIGSNYSKLNDINTDSNTGCNIKNKNNKNYKGFYENTFNSFEETTNINEYDNNPINKISLEEDKFIFNISNMKSGNYEFINKKILNNSIDYIKTKENVIEKSGELFYSVDESFNLYHNSDSINIVDDKEEMDINEENKIYFKYKVVDKSKRLIGFFSSEEQDDKNKDENINKKFKAKISLDLYLKIIKKIIPEKDSKINYNEKQNGNEDNNKCKVLFSVRSYETFIKKLIDDIEVENKNSMNRNEINNEICEFESKIKELKKFSLYLLVKKHYLKKGKEKLNLILENNPIIKKKMDEINDLFLKLKNKNNNIPSLINILKENESISNRDIKKMKTHFKEENNKNINEGNKSLINYSSLILPFFYIIKFFNTFPTV